MDIKKLLEEYHKLKEDFNFEEPVDPIKAIKDALIALGVEEPTISGENDIYEITYTNHGKIFDDAFIRNIVSRFEDELNEYFE